MTCDQTCPHIERVDMGSGSRRARYSLPSLEVEIETGGNLKEKGVTTGARDKRVRGWEISWGRSGCESALKDQEVVVGICMLSNPALNAGFPASPDFVCCIFRFPFPSFKMASFGPSTPCSIIWMKERKQETLNRKWLIDELSGVKGS